MPGGLQARMVRVSVDVGTVTARVECMIQSEGLGIDCPVYMWVRLQDSVKGTLDGMHTNIVE